MLAAYEDKTAEAVCTFAYCGGPGEEVVLFQGRTKVSRKVISGGWGGFRLIDVSLMICCRERLFRQGVLQILVRDLAHFCELGLSTRWS